ncbi:MAG: DUF2085 domain-containing protein [Phycisphaerae bacterium]|jgi:hypothetical protein
MDLAAELFSHLCGQQQCFAIDGTALPLCPRCLGLYLGAAATAVWIVAGRLWRRGLPPVGVLVADGAALAAAMLGGLHWIAGGPAWRMICGLLSGHVFLLWLVSGAAHLWRAGRSSTPPVPWRRGPTIGALAMIPLLVAAGWAFAAFLPSPRRVWVWASIFGLVALAGAAAWAVTATVRWAFMRR